MSRARWVASIALLLGGSSCNSTTSRPSGAEASHEAAPATAKAGQAVVDDVEAASQRLRTLETAADALSSRISSAITAVVDAQNEADRADAKATLQQLQREQYELQQRIDAARAALRGSSTDGLR